MGWPIHCRKGRFSDHQLQLPFFFREVLGPALVWLRVFIFHDFLGLCLDDETEAVVFDLPALTIPEGAA